MIRKRSSDKLYIDLDYKISSGYFAPGAAIPSENELSEYYKLSRPTVRRVLDRLCGRKLLEKRPGIGTFVRDPKMDSEDYMFRPFRIGTDHLYDYSPHYSGLIVKGFNDSPYGRNYYLKPLDSEQIRKGILDVDVDAMILKNYPDEVYEKMLRFGKPILANNAHSSLPEIASIRVDHYREAKLAVDYLIRYGWKDIALIGASDSMNTAIGMRSAGWRDAFADAGLEAPVHLCLACDSLSCHDSEGIRHFLLENSFSAAFFTNAMFFMNFHPYCSSLLGNDGFRKLKIMVFDNMEPFRDYRQSSLSYIKMPLEDFGSMSLEYLLRKSHDPDYPVMNRVLPCSMVIRHSELE